MQRFVLVGLLLCCYGCGQSDDVQRAAVSGKVTIDGVAVDNGTIAFIPSGGNKGPTAGAAIQNGVYTIAADNGPVIGPNRVELHASKKTGRKVQMPMAAPGTMTDEVTEAFPKHYNVESTLVAEIKWGKNVCDYEVTSK